MSEASDSRILPLAFKALSYSWRRNSSSRFFFTGRGTSSVFGPALLDAARDGVLDAARDGDLGAARDFDVAPRTGSA